MKRIFAILSTFAIMLCMFTITVQVPADDSENDSDYENNCSSNFEFNWDFMDDFFDSIHGQFRIHGKVLGYYNSEKDDSSVKPLEQASVSISLISTESDSFFSDEIDIPPVIPIPDWKSDMEDIWSSDDNSKDINSSYLDDLDDWLSDLKDINFSSMYEKKPSVNDYLNDYNGFEEIHLANDPSSSLDDIINRSWANGLYLWRHTFTDENGEFDFDFLKPGTYEIKASKMGYESQTKTVTIDDNSAELNFLLNATALSNVFNEIFESVNVSLDNVSNYLKTRIQIDDAIVKGEVGCRIVINENNKNYVHIYTDNLTIKATNITDNKLSVKISGDENTTGKTIEIQVNGELFYDSENLIIEYDGEAIRMADDLDDVLNPNDDGSHPEYWIVHDVNGTHIIISIPHFSEHQITVYSAPIATLGSIVAAESDIMTMIALYVVICAVAAFIFVGSIGLRKRFR